MDVPKILSSNRFQSFSFPIALLLLLLCFSAIFPYVMVGKGTVYFRVNDWEIRHAVPLMAPLSLLYAHTLREIKIFDTAINKNLKYCVFGTMILLANFVILTYSYGQKINRDNFTKAFGDKMVNIFPDLPNARIKITGAGIPKPEIRSYEANYLFYNLYGSSNRWVKFFSSGSDSEAIFVVPEFVKNSQAFQDLQIYQYNDVHDTRCLHIEIEVLGYEGFSNVIQNFTFRNNKKTIEIVKMKEC